MIRSIEILNDKALTQTGGDDPFTLPANFSGTFIGLLTYTPLKLGSGAAFNTVDQIGEGSSAATGMGSTSSSDGITSFFLSFFGVL